MRLCDLACIWQGRISFFEVFVSCRPFCPSFATNGAAFECFDNIFGAVISLYYTIQLYNLQKEKAEKVEVKVLQINQA